MPLSKKRGAWGWGGSKALEVGGPYHPPRRGRRVQDGSSSVAMREDSHRGSGVRVGVLGLVERPAPSWAIPELGGEEGGSPWAETATCMALGW